MSKKAVERVLDGVLEVGTNQTILLILNYQVGPERGLPVGLLGGIFLALVLVLSLALVVDSSVLCFPL